MSMDVNGVSKPTDPEDTGHLHQGKGNSIAIGKKGKQHSRKNDVSKTQDYRKC